MIDGFFSLLVMAGALLIVTVITVFFYSLGGLLLVIIGWLALATIFFIAFITFMAWLYRDR